MWFILNKMIQTLSANRIVALITYASAIILQTKAQVTEFNLYGDGYSTFPSFPYTLDSIMLNPTDYTQRVNEIAIYWTSVSHQLVLEVNQQGSYASTVTSGPCFGETLELIYSRPGWATAPNPIYIAANERVVQVDVGYSDVPNTNMAVICIYVKDNTDQWTNGGCYGPGNDIGYTRWGEFHYPYWNQEIVGFKNGLPTIGGPCKMTGLSVYYRPILCASVTIDSIDVSQFDNGNQTLVTGTDQAYEISYSSSLGINPCPVTYLIEVQGPNADLITLSGSYITFAASNVIKDLGTYFVNVSAQINVQTTWSEITTANYTYVYPCEIAKMPNSVQCPDSITVEIGKSQTSAPFALFLDSATTAVNNGKIICDQTVNFYVVSAPSSTANETMYQKFTYAATAPFLTTGIQKIHAAPSLPTEVGSYILEVVGCLNANSASCAQCSFEVSIFTATVLSSQQLSSSQPPYFKSALPNQFINICPGQQTKLWKFEVPTAIDPNGGTVRFEVNLNSEYFTFLESDNTIEQTKEQFTPTKYTISITLINEQQESATYLLKVEFQCKGDQDQNQNQTQTSTYIFDPQQRANVTKRTQYALAYIKNVEQDGLMSIAFRQKMKIPENITAILNGYANINGKKQPNMKINVIPGRLSDINQLNFTSQFVSFTELELKIQLNFQNLKSISLFNMHREQINVQIYGSELFRDIYGNEIERGIILQPVYLPQLTSASTIQEAKVTALKATQVVTSLVASNFILGVFIQPPMEQMLGSIRHLQIILHALLLNLSYPAATNTYFGAMMSLVTFQLIPTSDFFNMVLSLDPNSDGNNPFNDQFNSMGYSAKYIIQNLGMLCFTVFITPLIYLVVLLIHFKCPNADKAKIFWNRQMFFGTWIKLVNETYLFLGLCAFLNCRSLEFDSYGNILNSLCAIFCALVVNLFPFFVIIFYNIRKNYDKIFNNEEDFMARYGQVLEDLNFLRMGQKATLYPFFSLLRKLSLIYVVLFMHNQPVFSLFALIYQAIIMISLVGYVPPFKSAMKNKLELMNEAFALLVCYQLFNFTDFLTDPDTRENVGYSLFATVIICILINIAVVGNVLTTITISKLKRNFYKCRHHRALKQIQKNRKIKQLLKEAASLNIVSEEQKQENNVHEEQQQNIKERSSATEQSKKIKKLQQQSNQKWKLQILDSEFSEESYEEPQIPIIDQEEQQKVQQSQIDPGIFNHMQNQNKQNLKKNKEFSTLKQGNQIHKNQDTFALQNDYKSQNRSIENQLDYNDAGEYFQRTDHRTKYENEQNRLSAYHQNQNQEEQKVSLSDQMKIKTRQRQQHQKNQVSFDLPSRQFDHKPAKNQEFRHREDVLVDYSHREQHQSNYLQERNESNDFNIRKNDFKLNYPSKNISLENRNFVEAKPKTTDELTIGEKIVKKFTQSPTVGLKKLSPSADSQLYNQQSESDDDFFQLNEQEQWLQFLQPMAAAPIPQPISAVAIISQLQIALNSLDNRTRELFQISFMDVPPKIKLELAQLFSKMDSMRPLNFSMFQQQLALICQPQVGLYNHAMSWSKYYSENYKFSKQHGIDFESAVDYRSGRITNTIKWCAQEYTENENDIRLGRDSEEARMRNIAFERLPPIEENSKNVAQNVHWYKALLQSEKIRNSYPEFFEQLQGQVDQTQ